MCVLNIYTDQKVFPVMLVETHEPGNITLLSEQIYCCKCNFPGI